MCEFCDWEDGEFCVAFQYPGGGLICTRPRGHDGPHVACGGTGHHKLAVWGGDQPSRFSVVVVREGDRARAVGCSTRTVEFVKEANPAADSFEVYPLETFWSMIADDPPNGWEASENDG